MLRDRVITALILLPILIWAIFWAPGWVFPLVVAVVIVGAAWEWASLMACTTRAGRALYTVILAAAVASAEWAMSQYPLALVVLVGASLGWWIFVATWMMLDPGRQPGRAACGLKGVCGLFVLVPTYAALTALHTWDEHGPWRLLFLLGLVWLADVGAYFAGRAFGRHKLAPTVSPGKTWEGVAGAFLISIPIIAVGAHFGLGFDPLWFFAAVCLLTVGISIVGDLAESMFKRQQGVKDSGTLLPGHGGLMDRIDSLTSAAPLFVGGMLLARVLA